MQESEIGAEKIRSICKYALAADMDLGTIQILSADNKERKWRLCQNITPEDVGVLHNENFQFNLYPQADGHTIIQGKLLKHVKCTNFIIGFTQKWAIKHCKNCYNLKQNLKLVIEREKLPFSLNSKIRNSVLTRREIETKVSMLRLAYSATTRKNIALADSMKQKLQKEVFVDKNDKVNDILHQIVQQNDTEKLLFELLLEKAQCTSKATKELGTDTMERLQIYAKMINENMQNSVKRATGVSKQCRYSSETIRIALSLYLKNKSSYSMLQQNTFICFPSIKTLEKYSKSLRKKSGSCPNLYLDFKKAVGKTAKNCLILLDEMKLQSGLAFSTSDHTIKGICDDSLTWASFLNEDENQNISKSIATYVNQYFIKIIGTQICFPGEFFFSNSPSNWISLKVQILHVISALQVNGFTACGFVSDSGTANVRCFKNFATEKVRKDTNSPFFKVEEVSMENRDEKNRRIYFLLCMYFTPFKVY